MTKLFFILTLLTMCFASCLSKPNTINSSPIILTAQIGGSHRFDTTQYVFVQATLINNSVDTFVYACMDCSWADSYTIDSKGLIIEKPYCYKNGPATIKIPPHKSVDYYLNLKTAKPLSELTEAKFKIGFNLIEIDKTKDIVSLINSLTDMKHIIWSNPIELNSLKGFLNSR